MYDNYDSRVVMFCYVVDNWIFIFVVWIVVYEINVVVRDCKLCLVVVK